jgi:hypothetical protein
VVSPPFQSKEHSVISDADAAALKTAIQAEVKTWHVLNFATPQAAVNFVNLAPAQGAGEAVFDRAPNGTVDTYYFL